MSIDTLPSGVLNELKTNFQDSRPQSMLDSINMSSESRRLVEHNSFALLIAVIADQSVKSEIAWNLPYELSQRIGTDHLNSGWIIEHIESIRTAIAQKPALHRFPQKITDYILSLSTIIETKYLSSDHFLNNSLNYTIFVSNIKEVSGISDKKANFLFLILVLDFNYKFANMENSAVLFDSHLEKWLSQRFNKKITKSEANQICTYVSPENPALLCPYIWSTDRKSK
ncbi:hypothetical protein [Sporolactobacillus laevolacticus]|uniref:hypothetical protein n=1 Tax=Sporolactobacillus laevolacticus TaxID=33018 RepID=UPI0025B286CF|nr:hypothetical protein [Sporolactobacillus laevolacticus]MDN3956384.1 hypothetical protein [Sporolactobacillus laevolacticus]